MAVGPHTYTAVVGPAAASRSSTAANRPCSSSAHTETRPGATDTTSSRNGMYPRLLPGIDCAPIDSALLRRVQHWQNGRHPDAADDEQHLTLGRAQIERVARALEDQ